MIESKNPVHDSRVMREALTLQEAGHDVSILSWDRTGKEKAHVEHRGIPIRRIPTDGFMYALGTNLLRTPVWWRRGVRVARRIPADAIHCHDLDTLPIGVRLKEEIGKPLIYDCHEIFGHMIEEDVPSFVSAYAFRMERRLARDPDRIITVTDALKEYLDALSGNPAIVVRNCIELPGEEYIPPPRAPFTVLYIGDLHPSRFLIPAIEVIGGMPDVRLCIGGTQRLTPLVRAKCAEFPNTTFLGPVPNEQVLERTWDAHAVLAMLDPAHRGYRVAFSTKIFEAMATGRPSINTKGLPGGDLVERERCGLTVPYTKQGLQEALGRLTGDPNFAERLGRTGLEAAKREYNWNLEGRKLVAVYDRLT